LHTFVVVTFCPAGRGTLVTLTHLGWPQSGLDDDTSDWEATFSYFAEAWVRVLDLFAGYFSR
jgi:hypothetical protein